MDSRVRRRFSLILSVVVDDDALLAGHGVEDVVDAGSSRDLRDKWLKGLLRLLIVVSIALRPGRLAVRLLLTHTTELHLLLGSRDFKQLLLEKHLLVCKVLLRSQELSSFLLFILIFEIIAELKLWRGKDLGETVHLTISGHSVALLILVASEASANRCLRGTMLVLIVGGRSLAIASQPVRLLKLRWWRRARVLGRLWGSPQACKQVRTACPRGRACVCLLPGICSYARWRGHQTQARSTSSSKTRWSCTDPSTEGVVRLISHLSKTAGVHAHVEK